MLKIIEDGGSGDDYTDRILLEAYYASLDRYVLAGKKVVNDNLDEIADAVLSDLGYDITEEGREYLKKNDFISW